jgi:hypothetical protein
MRGALSASRTCLPITAGAVAQYGGDPDQGALLTVIEQRWCRLSSSLAAVVLAAGVACGLAPASASADDCPNAQLRSGASAQLPDCRAYEQVSPVDKNDGDVSYGPEGLTASTLVPTLSTPGGELVTFSSFYAFAGNPAAPVLNQYLSSRSDSGWSTRGISPRKSAPFGFLDTVSGFTAFSEDLSHSTVVNWAEPGQYNLFKRDPDGSVSDLSGGPGLATPQFGGASDDFSRILFSRANGLYEWSGGALTQFNLINGTPVTANFGDGFSGVPPWGRVMSRDGSYVYWSASTTGHLYDTEADVNIEYAASECTTGRTGEPGPGGNCLPPGTTAPPNLSSNPTFYTSSADGVALFTSPYQLTDDAYAGNLYTYDPSTTPHLTNLTPAGPEPDGALVQGVVGASDDLDYVYFVARGVLTEEPNEHGDVATAGALNLYAHHDGEKSFIGQLAATDALLWSENFAPLNKSTLAQVSADGGQLLLVSRASLTGYDNAGQPTAYLYDADTDRLSCLSCNPDPAVPPSGAASLGRTRASAGAARTLTYRSIASDGSRAYFETPDALLPRDTNNRSDVYQWEAEGTGSCLSAGGCVSLVSSGRSEEGSWYQGMSASGDDVFFITRERLVGQDTDDLMDLYDARVGGGLASQVAPPYDPPCSSVADCRGASPSPPPPPGTASETLNGPGNPVTGPRRAASFRPSALSQRQRRLLAAGGTVALRVRVSAPGLVRAVVRGRLGGQTRTIARAQGNASRVGTVTLRLRLARPARRHLARGRRLVISVRVSHSRASGARTLRATLKRPSGPSSKNGGRR